MKLSTEIRRTGRYGYVGGGAALTVSVLAVFILATMFPTFPGDRWLLEQVLTVHNPGLTAVANVLDWTGSLPVAAVLVLASLTVLWFRAPRMQFFTALSGSFLMVLALALKFVIARPRPDSWISEAGSISFGFPSGHTVFATVFFGLAIVFVGNWVHRPGVRLATQAGFMLLILAFGLSRAYLGAHWPSDVIGGWLYGAAAVLALSWLTETLNASRGSPSSVPASSCPETDEKWVP